MTAALSEVIRGWLGWCPNARALQTARATTRMETIDPEMLNAGPGGGIEARIGRHGQEAVAITAAFCLIALTVVLKNVLMVPAEVLNRDIILYIIVYLGFIMTFFSVKDQADPSKPGRWPLVWCAVVAIVTLGIVGVYAL